MSLLPQEDIQTVSIEVEGLEEFFELPTTQMTGSAGHPPELARQVPDNAGHIPFVKILPLAEAMIQLRLSERSIRRRVKSGALETQKDENGRLFIVCPALPGTTPVALPDTAGHPPEPARQSPDNDRLWQLVQEQASKIEILTTRNGYLHHQVESQQEQIKLLTDRQYKFSWLQQLRKLFAHQN